MKSRALAFAKVAGFLVLTVGLGLVVVQAMHPVTRSVLVAETLLCAIVLATSLAATTLERRPLASVGFADGAPARRFVAGVGVGTVIVGGCAGVFACLGWYHATLAPGVPSAQWLAMAVALCALVALFEETLFRGYALQTVANAFGGASAVVVTGVLFGALHLLNPTPGVAPWLELVGCGCVAAYGMLGAILRLASGSVWLPMGMHFAWNLLEQFVFGFPDSGIASGEGLLRATVTGPVLLTGGAYGPEAGLIMLGLAGAAGAVAVKAIRGYARSALGDGTRVKPMESAPSRDD